MYNGIGLLTPRGSGTSGHVQNNAFNLRGGPPARIQPRADLDNGPKLLKADQTILEHNAKRVIELKIAEEQARLEDEGVPEEEQQEAIEMYRALLMKAHAGPASAQEAEKKLTDETHALAQRKEDQMNKLAKALGVTSQAKEGDAFNVELQEQKRQERQDARELRELEEEARVKREAKALKAAEKAAKKAEKEKQAKEANRAEVGPGPQWDASAEGRH
ncbi:hypothetical protein V8C86DRAFT_2624162 [Haematococcus lacustris]